MRFPAEVGELGGLTFEEAFVRRCFDYPLSVSTKRIHDIAERIQSGYKADTDVDTKRIHIKSYVFLS